MFKSRWENVQAPGDPSLKYSYVIHVSESNNQKLHALTRTILAVGCKSRKDQKKEPLAAEGPDFASLPL